MKTPAFMEFEVSADHAMLRVFLGAPVQDVRFPGRWTCEFGWRGAQEFVGHGFGATSLGALTNAIALLETRLAVTFPGECLTQMGLPFILPGSPGTP